MTGIYIHVPFCRKKCPYCDFFSLPSNQIQMDKYTASLINHIERFNCENDNNADTIYFGGGTPSLLGSERIYNILNAIYNKFNVINPEITIEVNPNTITNNFFRDISSYGVNRISVGLQSANQEELILLGRTHTPEDVKKVSQLAIKSGIENLTFDLIIGLPNQNSKKIENSISFCRQNGAKHISTYMLQIEKGTKFYAEKEILNIPDDNKTADLYLFTCSQLEQSGYKQYEISNFCERNFESKHNLKYWNSEQYIGFGPSAYSYYDGKRFSYSRSLQDFLKGVNTTSDDDIKIKTGSFGEYAMLRLRLAQGLSNEQCMKKFGYKIPQSVFKNAEKYKNTGLLVLDKNHINFTPKGFLVSNILTEEILNDYI